MMKDIVGRKIAILGVTIRELKCGHFVKQKPGGKAHSATRAQCDQCDVEAARVRLAAEIKDACDLLEQS